MKKYIFLAVLLVNAAGLVANEQQKLDSEIEKVTVFLQKAQIDRTVEFWLEPGVSEIVLQKLSHSIDPSSIQVSGKGSFIILGVKLQTNYLQENQKPKSLVIFEDSLKYYKNQIIYKNNSKEVLRKEEALLLANQKIGGDQKPLTVEELKSMADFFRNRLNNISLEMIKVDEEILKINSRIRVIENQTREILQGWVRKSGEVVVSLSTTSRVKARLNFNYIVTQAGWRPMYDIRATEVNKPIKLQYKADVYQNTGVNWKNVSLILSTSNPTLTGQKPELYTWYLSYSNPQVLKALRGRVAGSPSNETKSEMAMDLEFDEEAEDVSNFTTVVQSSLNTSFEIALKYSVLTGGKPEMVDIQSVDLEASYEYAAAPKLDKDVFLLARITGWEQLSLLPGKASIYFEGTYVSNSYIDPANTNDTLNLSLGRDKRIVVNRKKVTDFTSKKVIGGKVRETYAYDIEIRNNKSIPIKLKLEDQIPVSQNSEITVQLLDKGLADFVMHEGKLVWNFELKPNESKKFTYSFEVRYPKDKVVSGL